MIAEPGLTPGPAGRGDRAHQRGRHRRRSTASRGPATSRRRARPGRPAAARGPSRPARAPGRSRRAIEPLDRRSTALLAALSAGERAAIERLPRGGGRGRGRETARLRVASRGGFVGRRLPRAARRRHRGVGSCSHSGAPRGCRLNVAPLGPGERAPGSSWRRARRGSTSPVRRRPASSSGRPSTGPLPDVRVVERVGDDPLPTGALAASRRRARIALGGAIPWTIELDGGLTDLDRVARRASRSSGSTSRAAPTTSASTCRGPSGRRSSGSAASRAASASGGPPASRSRSGSRAASPTCASTARRRRDGVGDRSAYVGPGYAGRARTATRSRSWVARATSRSS